jgi:hypothetical protein
VDHKYYSQGGNKLNQFSPLPHVISTLIFVFICGTFVSVIPEGIEKKGVHLSDHQKRI